MSLLDEMAELGCPPGSVTFASAMLACERAGQWQHVLRIMDQVQNKYILLYQYFLFGLDYYLRYVPCFVLFVSRRGAG